MKLIVGNISTKAVIGGADHLSGVDVMAELRKYLRVRVKGYQYSKQWKSKHWDGYKNFITTKGEFATGFLPMVAKFADDLGIQVEVEDQRTNIPRLNEEITEEIGVIDGEVWVGRDYQVEALKSINNYITVGGQELYFPRGILDCATNAGKNSIAAMLINNLPKDTVIVFMVSSSVIYDQAVEFFQQVLGKEKLGQVCAKYIDLQRVNVCMSKTLYNRANNSIQMERWLQGVNCLIVDESDEAGQEQYSKLLTKIHAPMRVFVSGTPLDGDVVTAMVQIGLSGKVLYKVSNKELIDKGVSQLPNIKIINSDIKEVQNPFITYDIELDMYVHSSRKRCKKIAEIVEKHKGEPILITFIHKQHGVFMYNYLKEYFEGVGLKIAIAHGTTSDRDQVLRDYKKGKIDVLLASMIMKRGANIPVIRVGILAHAGKSKTTTKQIIGRLIRHDGENKDVMVYEFWDGPSKYLEKHSKERIKVYQSEGFNVEYLYPNKKGKPLPQEK